jgi:8-amino-3,8-dideoxy-alpha-D-manno-octulosonate transaminase
VQRFEEDFAKYIGTRFALGVTSGTAALDCAMAGLDIGPGDEVIVGVHLVVGPRVWSTPGPAVFADIDRRSCRPEIASGRSPRTKAVIAVHLLGGLCDLDPILEIARQHKIAVLEDAAQCVGGSYHGKKLGSLGDVGIYSFQINKMMTSGEGGAVVTSDPAIYERAVHDMGDPPALGRTHRSQPVGTCRRNFRMNEFTGAVLGAQLTKLDRMIGQLRGHAETVYDGIKGIPGIRLRQRPDPAGDIGYCVGFELKDKATRDRCLQELRQRKVPASTLTGSVLLPIEESVINKRARHPNWPSFTSPEGKAVQYGPDTCRQTLGVFDRFAVVRMGTKYTDKIDNYIVDAIRQVHGMVA